MGPERQMAVEIAFIYFFLVTNNFSKTLHKMWSSPVSIQLMCIKSDNAYDRRSVCLVNTANFSKWI